MLAMCLSYGEPDSKCEGECLCVHACVRGRKGGKEGKREGGRVEEEMSRDRDGCKCVSARELERI